MARHSGRSDDWVRGLGGLERSAPAQKDGPLPVNMTAAISLSMSMGWDWDSAMVWNVFERARITSLLKQLFLDGRLMDTTIALLPELGNSITSLVTTGDAMIDCCFKFHT